MTVHQIKLAGPKQPFEGPHTMRREDYPQPRKKRRENPMHPNALNDLGTRTGGRDLRSHPICTQLLRQGKDMGLDPPDPRVEVFGKEQDALGSHGAPSG